MGAAASSDLESSMQMNRQMTRDELGHEKFFLGEAMTFADSHRIEHDEFDGISEVSSSDGSESLLNRNDRSISQSGAPITMVGGVIDVVLGSGMKNLSTIEANRRAARVSSTFMDLNSADRVEDSDRVWFRSVSKDGRHWSNSDNVQMQRESISSPGLLPSRRGVARVSMCEGDALPFQPEKFPVEKSDGSFNSNKNSPSPMPASTSPHSRAPSYVSMPSLASQSSTFSSHFSSDGVLDDLLKDDLDENDCPDEHCRNCGSDVQCQFDSDSQDAGQPFLMSPSVESARSRDSNKDENDAAMIHFNDLNENNPEDGRLGGNVSKDHASLPPLIYSHGLLSPKKISNTLTQFSEAGGDKAPLQSSFHEEDHDQKLLRPATIAEIPGQGASILSPKGVLTPLRPRIDLSARSNLEESPLTNGSSHVENTLAAPLRVSSAPRGEAVNPDIIPSSADPNLEEVKHSLASPKVVSSRGYPAGISKSFLPSPLSPNRSFQVGDLVKIHGGSYPGHEGRIEKVMKVKIKVFLTRGNLSGQSKNLMPDSLTRIESDPNEQHMSETNGHNQKEDVPGEKPKRVPNHESLRVTSSRSDQNPPAAPSAPSGPPSPSVAAKRLECGDKVLIIKGSYRGRHGVVKKVMKVRVRVLLDGDDDKTHDLNRTSMVFQQGSCSNHANEIEAPESNQSANILHEARDIKTNCASQQRPPRTPRADSDETITAQENLRSFMKTGESYVISGGQQTRSPPLSSPFCETRSSQSRVAENETVSVNPEEVPSICRRRASSRTQNHSPARSACPPPAQHQATVSNFSSGDRVYITGGTHKGKRGEVASVTALRVRVKFPEDDVVRYLKPEFLELIDEEKDDHSGVKAIEHVVKSSLGQRRAQQASRKRSSRTKSNPTYEIKPGASDAFRCPDSDQGSLCFGNRRISEIRTTAGERNFITFLDYMFGTRIFRSISPLDKKELSTPFQCTVDYGEGRYELVLSKIIDDPRKSSLHCIPKAIECYYVRVSGIGLAGFSLKEALERLADFGALRPRKVIARLELLQSPARMLKGVKEHAVRSFSSSMIGEIKDKGHEGCGFICEKLLLDLVGHNSEGMRTLSIQVRIFSPSHGVFKGVLIKKRIPEDDPRKIHLPSSMRKVGPSRHHDRVEDEACIVITNRQQSDTNWKVGRMINDGVDTLPKSFAPKKLSNMILRLWQALGVPAELCKKYQKASKYKENLEHSFVVGASDPTEQLPPGTMYVTGLTKLDGIKVRDNMFITRSPCNEPSDGMMLPLVTSRPELMSSENWEFLESLPFGAVIFAFPGPGESPLPPLIASGDLDGDLYFVTWNEEIHDHLNVRPLGLQDRLLNESSGDKMEVEPTYDPEWLEKAQELMINAPRWLNLGQMVGALWNTSKKIADSSPDFMNDEDAKAFARAYKEALDIGKHGGQVGLPGRLHGQLHQRYHDLLYDNEDSSMER